MSASGKSDYIKDIDRARHCFLLSLLVSICKYDAGALE